MTEETEYTRCSQCGCDSFCVFTWNKDGTCYEHWWCEDCGGYLTTKKSE